ncbi:MAG: hypothetical protein GQ534_07545 [Candidatus Delongbacteria bacterium]|nr:hypothetical protein [Candidatus Delongbacteria bacterium]
MCQKEYEEIITKESAEEHTWFTFLVDDDYEVNIILKTEKLDIILTEANSKGKPIGGTYSAKIHKPHSTVGKKHIHVYSKNNQLFSINIDGSAHDDSHGVKIPNKVVKGMKKNFPNFIIPKDNLIEDAPDYIYSMLDYWILNEDDNEIA